MASWENHGSMQDLSRLAKDSLAVSSQAATNTISDNSAAMTAPGSDSETSHGEPAGHPMPDGVPAASSAPGTDGKPKARSGNLSQPRPAWSRIKGGNNG